MAKAIIGDSLKELPPLTTECVEERAAIPDRCVAEYREANFSGVKVVNEFAPQRGFTRGQ